MFWVKALKPSSQSPSLEPKAMVPQALVFSQSWSQVHRLHKLDGKDLLQSFLGCLGDSVWEPHIKLYDKIPALVWVLGVWETFPSDPALCSRLDDVFE